MSILHFIFSDATTYWKESGCTKLSFFHYMLGNGLANVYIHNWIRMDPLLKPGMYTAGYLIAKWIKKIVFGEDVYFDFCWYFGSYSYSCIIRPSLFDFWALDFWDSTGCLKKITSGRLIIFETLGNLIEIFWKKARFTIRFDNLWYFHGWILKIH